MLYILIGIGGVIGSLLRYYVSILSIRLLGNAFPFGTLFVNLTGAFILGWLTKNLTNHRRIHPYLVSAIGTGVIGSYTTFSTLSVETITFLNNGQMLKAFLYICISLFGGFALAYLGFHLRNGERQGKKG